MIPKKMFLLDGSAIFYRSYFAFIRNPLINSKGENTSAVFGFSNSLLKILKEEKSATPKKANQQKKLFDTPRDGENNEESSRFETPTPTNAFNISKVNKTA